MNRNSIDKEVYELLNEAEPVKPHGSFSRKWFIFFAMILTGIAIVYFSFNAIVKPRGQILKPIEGATVSPVFQIEGYTKFLPVERKYIWITVDVPSIGLCWPHRQIYKANDRFTAKIHEKGPNAEFIVSVYAVNRDYHNEIREWFEFAMKTGSDEGFPIMPENLKLDSVTLKLKE
jgi:hypothetical protein